MQKHFSIFNFLIYILLSLALVSTPLSAAVSYRAAAKASSTTDSLTINKPAGTVTGDVMIAAISTTLSTRTVTLLSGWTLISSVTQTSSISSRLSTYWKVATASEPASYTWTISGTGSAAGGITTFIGVNTSNPIGASATALNAKTQNATAPSITTTRPYGMLLTIHELPSSVAWTPPTGMTEVVDVASLTPTVAGGISMEMNYQVRSTAGATGTRAATNTSSGNIRDPYISQSISLLPYINPLHHFQIRHDGNGLTCAAETIYVKACSDVSCNTLYNTDITVTPSSPIANTTWVPTSGTLTANTELTFQLTHTVAETVTLDMNPAPSAAPSPSPYISTSPLSADVCTDLLGNAKSCSMTFYHGALTYTVPTQTACATSSAITISARGTDGIGLPKACAPLITSSTNISFSFSPAPSPSIVMNQGQGNQATFTTTAAQAVNLAFNASGNATITLTHNNAGQFTLGAFRTSDSTVLGSSTFTFKPYNFFLQANTPTTPSETALNNATAAGNPKWKASDNFRFRLRGQCQNGTITTNYVPSKAEMWVQLALPSAGNNSNFTLQGTDYLSLATAPVSWSNISSKFTSGAITDGVNNYADAAFHEVGVLNLHVRDADYFGATLPEQTLTVGRFTPHHFDTTVASACTTATPFTYSGQAFSVTTTARNNKATPSTTLNYTGSFAFDTTLTNAGTGTAGSFNATNVIPAASYSNGIATKADVVYTLTTKDTAADTIILRANDEGTGSAAGVTEGTTNIRSGRLRLESVFGLGLKPLSMPLYAEYYSDNGTTSDTSDDGFITNTDDSCSTYTITAGSDVNFTGDLADNDVDQTGSSISAGLSSILFHDPGNIALGPGSGNDGTVNLFLNNIANWLRYDWLVDCDNADGDNNISTGVDTGACGTASFGIFRGDDRIIHWREIF